MRLKHNPPWTPGIPLGGARRRLGCYLALSLASKLALAAVPPLPPGVACAAFILPEMWLLYQIFVPNAAGLGPVGRGRPGGHEVVLTIDDGPDPQTTFRVLQLLEAHGAKAVFFVIGEKVRAHPELARAIAAAGHELGNHTDSHPHGSFWRLAPARAAAEIDRCAEAVESAAGFRPRLFRAPAGIKNPALFVKLEDRGLAYLGWDCRGRDTLSSSPGPALGRLVRGLRPGAVLLTHESGWNAPVRLAVIAGLLREIERRGLRCALPPRFGRPGAAVPSALRPPAPAGS